MSETRNLRVLELYAGIGGMHFALKASGIPFEVVQAMEINDVVLATYNHNFPRKPALPRNIEGLTADEINMLDIDLIVMSPPCQPFCRTGRKLDIQDARSSSFAHLLTILPDAKFQYLLLENVKGFEASEARDALLSTMKKCDMNWQEFLLSPRDCNVPNSRSRYYLLAKKNDLKWCFERSEELMTSVPFWNSDATAPYASIVDNHNLEWDKYRKKRISEEARVSRGWCVGDILEKLEDSKSHLIPASLVTKYGIAMDIVTTESTNTNCFTKGYGTFIKGTGSYIAQNSELLQDTAETAAMSMSEKLMKMKLRYFTPKEVARLLCFPETFTFPPSLSTKQRYRALGESCVTAGLWVTANTSEFFLFLTGCFPRSRSVSSSQTKLRSR